MTYRYTKLDDGEGLDGGPRYEIEEVCGFVSCVVDDEDTARLFCAAPDLLEALEDLLADDMQGMTTAERAAIEERSLYGKALAAIAKAKGGAR